MLTIVSGEFVKIAYAADAHVHLERGHAHRPAARFNRQGQDALYLSPDAEAAHIAIGGYINADDPPRVLLRFELSECRLVDMRHPDAAAIYELARQPWQQALAAGAEPASWGAADRLRAKGHAGLIDPSRRCPGRWHITLFEWNADGAPGIRPLGPPEPFQAVPDYRGP